MSHTIHYRTYTKWDETKKPVRHVGLCGQVFYKPDIDPVNADSLHYSYHIIDDAKEIGSGLPELGEKLSQKHHGTGPYKPCMKCEEKKDIGLIAAMKLE